MTNDLSSTRLEKVNYKQKVLSPKESNKDTAITGETLHVDSGFNIVAI